MGIRPQNEVRVRGSVVFWEEGGRQIIIEAKKSKIDGFILHFNLFQLVDKNHQKLLHTDITAINDLYKKNIIDAATARLQLKVLVKTLYKERDRRRPKNIINDVNYDLFEAYWAQEYGDSRQVIDKATMHADFLRAIASLGNTSLTASDQPALQSAVNKHFEGHTNKQRRAVSRLNTLLQFVRRGFGLKKWKEEFHAVRHLTLADFEKVMAVVDDYAFKVMCYIAFGTGLRASEIMGLSDAVWSPSKKHLNISMQLKPDQKKHTATKNRKHRKAYVMPEAYKWLEGWFRLDDAERARLRPLRFARLFRVYCKKVFPKTENKHCAFHDLRHSYAIHLLSREVPLDYVAQSLGNSRFVCEKYYTGYILADASIAVIDNFMKKTANSPE